jgi:uncharacterized phage-associated protein
MESPPRYIPSPEKALETILWLANEWPGIDVYHIVKAAFYADKHHVSEYGRPIVGDQYEAAPFGPLPQVIYGLLRHDPIELLAFETNGALPFDVDSSYRVTAQREANLRRLSESDVEALRRGLGRVRGKTFRELYDETHADPAYQRASGIRMDYREFIDDSDPEKAEKAEYLAEVASIAVL